MNDWFFFYIHRGFKDKLLEEPPENTIISGMPFSSSHILLNIILPVVLNFA